MSYARFCACLDHAWGTQEELATNVFMRCGDPAVAEWCGLRGAQPAAVLAELRYRKDHFTLTSSLISRSIGLISFFRPLARYFWLTH